MSLCEYTIFRVCECGSIYVRARNPVCMRYREGEINFVYDEYMLMYINVRLVL